MNNRDYMTKVNPNFLQLGNYYGRPVDTSINYNFANGVQIVPVFQGVSYDKPNYNSLTHGSCVNHAIADHAYIAQNCVNYRIRYDGPSGSYYEEKKSGPSGPAATKPQYFDIKKPAGMSGR